MMEPLQSLYTYAIPPPVVEKMYFYGSVYKSLNPFLNCKCWVQSCMNVCVHKHPCASVWLTDVACCHSPDSVVLALMDAVGPAPALVLALTPIVKVENGTRPLMITEVVELSRKLSV